MATVVQTLVDELRDAHGITEAQALRYLDRRHKKMVARSKCFKKAVAVGNTVAGTAFYALASIIELYSFEVGGVPYTKARRPDLYAYSQGTLVWEGQGEVGLIISDASAAGVRGISIIPTPTSVQAIVAYAAVEAPDLVLAGGLLTDPDFDDALVDGASATVLKRHDERSGEAQGYENTFDNACEELRRRVSRRFRGPGPAQIRVAGLNA